MKDVLNLVRYGGVSQRQLSLKPRIPRLSEILIRRISDKKYPKNFTCFFVLEKVIRG